MILPWGVIAQQGGRFMLVHDDHVEVAVIVKISEGASTADVTGIDRRAGLVSHSGKGAVAPVAEEHARAFVRKLRIDALDFRVDIPGDPEDVRIAIVVEVKDARAPTDILAFTGEAGGLCLVLKLTFAEVPVEAGGLELEMRLDDVEVAIQVVVADADSHSGHLLPIRADGHAAHQAFFAEGAVVVVEQQQACGGVTGHIEIWPAIFVGIKRNGRQPVRSFEGGDPRLLRDIGEGAVPVVPIQGK